jgi:excisionase family DNA binding protein
VCGPVRVGSYQEVHLLSDVDRITLTVEEAAELLGISRGLAYQLVAQGDIPSVRLGRRIVVPRRALDALLDTAK